MTQNFPLKFLAAHMFIELNHKLWLLDTGSPVSFGDLNCFSILEQEFEIGTDYMGFSAANIREFIDLPCVGLLGADVLGNFDYIFDIPEQTMTISSGQLQHSGRTLELSEVVGIPIFTAQIQNRSYRLFFDTGAQISYFQDPILKNFPPKGKMTDFYPGLGRFETETYQLELSLGGEVFKVRCGQLPGLLGGALMMANAKGVIGNEILSHRRVGYFPRRQVLVL